MFQMVDFPGSGLQLLIEHLLVSHVLGYQTGSLVLPLPPLCLYLFSQHVVVLKVPSCLHLRGLQLLLLRQIVLLNGGFLGSVLSLLAAAPLSLANAPPRLLFLASSYTGFLSFCLQPFLLLMPVLPFG